MELSNNLIKLSNVCNDKNGKIYVVGGAVRNSIMGLPYDDIDICGTFTPDEIMELATTCGFRSQVVNAKLGTVLITTDNEQYEYTTFRSENYVKGHSPSSVDFVNDIKVDAARRDFTINALYYDIYTGNVLDFYNGRTDIANKVIKTIETPDFVFASDGLRLLRLIRFASELDFKIDKPTLKQAKANIYMLNDISAERKLKELRMILFSDFRYGKTNKCIEYFNKLNVYPYLFKLNNFKIKNSWAAPRVMATTLDIRYLSFCIMLLMNKYKFRHIPINQLQFDVNNIFGATGLKDSNANISNLLKVYSVIQNFLFAKNTDVYDVSLKGFGMQVVDASNLIESDEGYKSHLKIVGGISSTKVELNSIEGTPFKQTNNWSAVSSLILPLNNTWLILTASSAASSPWIVLTSS